MILSRLYNPTSDLVNISNWTSRVQNASSTGTSWQVTNLNGTIPAHGFFLVQEHKISVVVVGLPTSLMYAGIIFLSSTV